VVKCDSVQSGDSGSWRSHNWTYDDIRSTYDIDSRRTTTTKTRWEYERDVCQSYRRPTQYRSTLTVAHLSLVHTDVQVQDNTSRRRFLSNSTPQVEFYNATNCWSQSRQKSTVIFCRIRRQCGRDFNENLFKTMHWQRVGIASELKLRLCRLFCWRWRSRVYGYNYRKGYITETEIIIKTAGKFMRTALKTWCD